MTSPLPNKLDSFDKELKSLALRLKSACNKQGIENEISKAAATIHQIGPLHFEQSRDNIDLIKSVGLLNSAIARNPNNVYKIKQNLSDICQHILQESNAQDQSADLIKQANYVKAEIESMREETNRVLRFLTNFTAFQKESDAKVKTVKNLQSKNSSNYLNIMKNLCHYCVGILGPPPCRFAVLGMGSLARKEITPYSDFEHMIVMENFKLCSKKDLKYFRWFSVIFHVVILNLQETIIPSLNIKYLNDPHTDLGDWFFDTFTSGICLDGMMPHACKFPLGRTQPTKDKPWTTELIKPVDQMLEYLSADINLKNGYHLSDVLIETCFVFGDETLHHEFRNGIEAYKQSKTNEEKLDDIKREVTEDLEKFATRMKLASLKPDDTLNIKQMFYRTSTLFIVALGKIFDAESSSSFDIIYELAEKNKISNNTKHKLSFAVAIACEMRLRVYMNEKSQRDYIKLNKNDETLFDNILQFISIESAISYLQITYCLQREIVLFLRIKETHLYSKSSLLNITIGYVLGLNKLMLPLMEKFEDNHSDYDEKNLDSNEEDLDSDDEDSDSEEEDSDSDKKIHVEKRKKHKINKNLTKLFADFDYFLARLELEINNAINTEDQFSSSAGNMYEIYDKLSDLALILSDTGKPIEEQLEFWKHSVEVLENISFTEKDPKKLREDLEMNTNKILVFFQNSIADCLIELNRFDEASVVIKQNLERFESQNIELEVYYYAHAGTSWFKIKNYHESLACLQTALGISISNNEDYLIVQLYNGIGTCLLKLGYHEEALVYLEIAVNIIKNLGIENDNREDSNRFTFPFNFATTFYNMGKCLIELQQNNKGLHYVYQALEYATESNMDEDFDEELVRHAEKSYFCKKRVENVINILYDLGSWLLNESRFVPLHLTYLIEFDN